VFRFIYIYYLGKIYSVYYNIYGGHLILKNIVISINSFYIINAYKSKNYFSLICTRMYKAMSRLCIHTRQLKTTFKRRFVILYVIHRFMTSLFTYLCLSEGAFREHMRHSILLSILY